MLLVSNKNMGLCLYIPCEPQLEAFNCLIPDTTHTTHIVPVVYDTPSYKATWKEWDHNLGTKGLHHKI